MCDRCTTQADLAVYMETNDLTAQVRACKLATVHTQAACRAPCLAALEQPYHLPNGSLNACLPCDEVQSGSVFKTIAGRTRRNTGRPNALCRPCAEVRALSHAH